MKRATVDFSVHEMSTIGKTSTWANGKEFVTSLDQRYGEKKGMLLLFQPG